MKEIIRILLFVLLEFSVYRLLFIFLGHILTHLFNKDKHFYQEKELRISILLYVVFTFVYFRTLRSALTLEANVYGEIYILYTIYGVFSVFWAYLHWGVTSWKEPLIFAPQRDNIIKKGILYAMVFIFALILGYHQTLSYSGIKEIDAMYSIANISVFTCIIALDRVMNQIYLNHNYKKNDKASKNRFEQQSKEE